MSLGKKNAAARVVPVWTPDKITNARAVHSANDPTERMALTMKALFSSDFNVDDSTTTDEPFMHVLMLDHGATDTDRAGCARSELLFLSCRGSLPGEIAQRRVPPAGGITFHAGIAAAGSVNALVTLGSDHVVRMIRADRSRRRPHIGA